MSDETAISKSAATEFELAVGGRDNLAAILSQSTRDAKRDVLFRLLMDPSRAGDSLAKLCRDAGVSATEVLAMYRDAVASQAMIRAQVTLAEKLDGVVRDVAEKAADHTKPCRCRRLSKNDNPDPNCDLCGGRGEVYKEGSLKHAEAVFKATGLHKEGGGVNVNVQQNVGIAAGGGLLDSFVKATDAAAFDIVEGETVPEGADEQSES